MLNARNEYAGLEAGEGVRVLEDVRDSMDRVGEDSEAELQGVIASLDEANGRLMDALGKLRETVVDAALQRAKDDTSTHSDIGADGDEDSNDGQGLERGRTLFTFIDPSKHETLQSSLRAQIDDFNTSRADLSTSLESFASHINVLHSLLSPPPPSPGPDLRPMLYDEPPASVTDLFHSMTDNAATMAELLQSLVSHYDLCVTALKHTEGGGEAAKNAVQQQRKSPYSSTSLPQSKENLEESLYRRDHAAPISADERKEMLRVLEHDSEEVDSVVAELTNHASDLESAYEKLSARLRTARTRDATLRQVAGMLHEMQDIHLPSHIHSMRTFTQDWSRIAALIKNSTAKLEELSEFYAEFLEGYRRLLREIERREGVELQMRKIAEKAGREIERVRVGDVRAREAFMEEVGAVLPGELGEGLRERARVWEVRKVE